MTSRLPYLLLGLSALTACASVPPPPPGPPTASVADRHRIEVAQTGERLDIIVSPGDVALTAKARSDLAALANGYMRYGHGALILSTPSGGPNSDSASLVTHEARLVLVDAGVPFSAIAGSIYDGSGAGDAPIVATFTRFEAHAPECAPLWEQDLAHQSDNQPWESFGCTTQANLAAMVEDPHDLLAARDEDPRDSGRRSVVFDHYRAGEVSHAARDSDERVTISNAVQ